MGNVWLALAHLDGSKRTQVVRQAISEYVNILVQVYNDIYESCIKVYYASYKPKVYTRHQNKQGFNLYIGFSAEVLDARIDATYMPESLMGYRNVTREEVLSAVVNGQRGVEHRVTPVTGEWPKTWGVKYPNQYSTCGHVWQSKAGTIESILQDFDDNGIEDTFNVLSALIAKYV